MFNSEFALRISTLIILLLFYPYNIDKHLTKINVKSVLFIKFIFFFFLFLGQLEKEVIQM